MWRKCYYTVTQGQRPCFSINLNEIKKTEGKENAPPLSERTQITKVHQQLTEQENKYYCALPFTKKQCRKTFKTKTTEPFQVNMRLFIQCVISTTDTRIYWPKNTNLRPGVYARF